MKLTVLTENVAGAGFLAEHGLSYLLETDETTLLFDTGHTDVFIKNALKLGFDICNQVQCIVLSHGHWDHGDGLQYACDKTLITHPGSFKKRFRKLNNSNIGLNMTEEKVKQKFNLITSRKPYNITPNTIFLGEIPRLNNFESQTTSFVDDKGDPDFVTDDSALAIVENNLLHVVTGCSHSGICNIIDYAMQVTGNTNIGTVIGGFHLKHNNRQTRETIQFLKEKKVKDVFPSHCTELEALAVFSNEFTIKQVKTGMIINI